MLPPDEFCRIHRAFAVSLGWIVSFHQGAVNGTGHLLPISETYRQRLLGRVFVITEKSRTEGIKLSTM